MAVPEIDSFICKFKQLLHSGMNAHLDIKTEAGKAIVTLTAEVDVHPHHRVQSRNGPSRQRRREKRAAAREAAETLEAEEVVVEAVVEETPEETKNETGSTDTIAVNASTVIDEESKSQKAVKASATGKKSTEEVVDEICPNEVYNKAKTSSSTSRSAAPPSTSRKPAFDYYTLEYEGSSDPD